ncbi:MAG: aspartate/glutamate racemase family protein [Candidatus Hodarchaeota archaeon]
MNNEQKVTIGILTGMGPKSTSPFLDLIIEQCQKQYGATYDFDFPHILIYSLPTPFYVEQEIDDKAMEASICVGLQKLESTGVDFISMPCNSAHKYFKVLEKCINIPLLHIVEATVKKLGADLGKTSILATRITIESGIYQEVLEQAGSELFLEEEWQQEVDNLIQAVKGGENEGGLLEIIERLSKYLREENVKTIIVACTDITAIAKMLSGFEVIDSSEALAEETIRTYLELTK